MKNSFLPFVVLAVALAVAVAVRCRSRSSRVESVRAPDGAVTKIVFYPDSSDGTNSVLTFRNGVLDGPVVRYGRRGSERSTQTIETSGIYRQGVPWEGTFLGHGSDGGTDDSLSWHGGDWLPVTFVTYSNGIPVRIYDSLDASDSPPEGWSPVRFLSDSNGVPIRTSIRTESQD